MYQFLQTFVDILESAFRLVLVVVRIFIDTQNRLVTLHTVLIKSHEETEIRMISVIYPVGSTNQYCSPLNG
jgi:hypothetical protein